MLGLGNEGNYLDIINVSSLYHSRNGGRTWKKVKDGRCIYESTGRGSVLVVTYDNNTNFIAYSFDDGLSWDECVFDNISTSIHPIDFLNNYNLNGAFSLLATDVGVYSIDFTTLRSCNDSDYEIWQPHDILTPCLLGKRVDFYRRKENANCSINSDYTFEVISNCDCTQADYSCAYCYDYNVTSMECDLNSDCTIYTAHKPPANCIGTYTSTPIYRRIGGTTCVNDLPLYNQPTTISCPTIPTTTTTTTTTTDTTNTIDTTTNTDTSTSNNVKSNDASSNDLVDEPGISITLIVFVVILCIMFVTLLIVYFVRAKSYDKDNK